jgi:hypothetical protein
MTHRYNLARSNCVLITVFRILSEYQYRQGIIGFQVTIRLGVHGKEIEIARLKFLNILYYVSLVLNGRVA